MRMAVIQSFPSSGTVGSVVAEGFLLGESVCNFGMDIGELKLC